MTPATGLVPSTQPQIRASRIGTYLGLGIGVVVVASVALAFLYSPGPPSFTLTRQTLAIHDRFYPVTVEAASVDLDGIRIVDVTSDADWRPTARTNGFANPHYRAGWFQVANGRKVRIYRADSTRLVLLPPKGNGTPVLLEAPNPEQFIAQVRQQWANR